MSDLEPSGTLHLRFLRSPHAHARINRIDSSRALAAPGVIAVLTAADLPFAAGLAGQTTPGMRATARPVLVSDVARFVGDPVAVVVAESPEAAEDAAALVEVEYRPLPAIGTIDEALAPSAPLVHPEFGTNLAVTLNRQGGDVDAAFARADRVISVRLEIPRITGVAMETYGAVAEWDAAAERLTLWCTTQAPWRVHGALKEILQLPNDQLRVIAPDVGGGFGVRGPVYGEYLVVGYLAHRFRRPTRWVATRQEDFLATQSSRETRIDAELAVTAAGDFLGLRVRAWSNLGAYASSPGPAQRLVALSTGAYAIPAAEAEVSGVYTNTNPTGAYRGAGRPEANFVVERLVDEAAVALGIDPGELRRRNFVRPDAFPYRTALGLTYDSGNYEATLDAALAVLAEGEGASTVSRGRQPSDSLSPEERAGVRGDDSMSKAPPHPNPLPEGEGTGTPLSRETAVNTAELIGIGIASYVEPTGGGWESGRVRVEPDGRVIAVTGSTSQGQNHRTTFAQIVADRLGVRFEDVELHQGDTADNLPGIGTFGSRSTALGGGALARTSDEVYQKGRQIAAHLLEAAPEDLVAREGRFFVAGSPDRAVTWAEVATAAASADLPPELPRDLDAQTQFNMGNEAFANGACIAVVGIDPTTGALRLRRLILAHDAGHLINPRLVAAQLHGGATQGAGEALGEWLRYDESGQLLAGSLLDYWIPRADDLPDFEIREVPCPTPLNPLGAKGVGEAGTIAVPPALVNAVLDALRPLGVRSIDMPLTPERIWSSIRKAGTPERLEHEARETAHQSGRHHQED